MSYALLRDKKTELIRKARDGSVFVGDTSLASITAITAGASADLIALPTGWEDLGWTTTDGVTFARTTTISDVNSFGSVEPTRSDVTKDTITMACTAQETKLITLGLYTGADLTATKAAKTTGEFQIDKPARPGFRYYRLLGLFVDDTNNGEIYIGRYLPRARVTDFGDQKFVDADSAVEMPMTFTGYEDAAAGFSHRWFFGGPGWLALLAEMGIEQSLV